MQRVSIGKNVAFGDRAVSRSSYLDEDTMPQEDSETQSHVEDEEDIQLDSATHSLDS